MILADKIIDQRKKNGWSQEELAEKLGVSRQSISKWEGAQSVPDMNRIIMMSEIFGVSTDYLLKDDMEPESASVGEEPALVRRVSMEEATAFLDFRNRAASLTSLGVMLCILSPVLLILLTSASELGYIPLSMPRAMGLGLIVLISMVACAVGMFVWLGIKGERYEYIEKEPIETVYGISGIVRERWERFRPAYTRMLISGIVLCILCAVPIFALMLGLGINSYTASFIAVGLLLILVAVGVFFIIRAAYTRGSFQMLLEEGEYTREGKALNARFAPIATVYWCVTVAVYLAWSFMSGDWDRTWLVWPVAGVLFGAIAAIFKAVQKKA